MCTKPSIALQGCALQKLTNNAEVESKPRIKEGDTRMTRISVLLGLVTIALISACERESATPTLKPETSAPLSANCDMSGDMSKMSAEEHQKMMEDCEKAKGGAGGQ